MTAFRIGGADVEFDDGRPAESGGELPDEASDSPLKCSAHPSERS
jgi:hypothetical protein